MKKKFLLSIAILSVIGAMKCNAQGLETTVVQDLTEEHVFSQGIEGPAVDKAGNLYVVSFGKDGTIGIIKPGQKPELFIELPKGSTGNGIRFNKAGEMFVADYTGHNVLKINMKTKAVSVFAHEEKMTQPNDIAMSPSGILFASDPKWKDQTGQLWRIDKKGTVTLLEGNMGTTNGVEVSPDGKKLYVNESIQRNVWVYDLDKKGNISNKNCYINSKMAEWMECVVIKLGIYTSPVMEKEKLLC